MFYLSCEEYYTNYLGDNCNNKCEECCGNKEIYVVKKDFEIPTYSVLQKDVIKKGSWYWIKHENPKNGDKLLIGQDGTRLHITNECFNLNFM